MTPQEARDHALAVLAAAEAAEQDAFMFWWARRTLGVGEQQAAGLIQEFRKWREERGMKAGGPNSFGDWAVESDDGKPQ